MELRLDNQVAIVTGAGRGIGAAIARTLAAAGACVAVNDLNPDRAEQVQDEIRAAGGQAVAIAADVSNKFQCAHLVESTRAAFGGLHILVNNAAVMPTGTILKMDEWDWNRSFEVNVKGVFLMTQLCGRVMADENGTHGGTIINIGSTAGTETAAPQRAAYAATKAAVAGFTRECAREFAAHHIRVNTLLPTETEGLGTKRPSLATTIANTVLYLCSNNATGLTGSLIKVDANEPD